HLDRRPRHRHADADFRTEVAQLHIARQGIGDQRLVLVIAVVAHRMAKQAGADTDQRPVLPVEGKSGEPQVELGQHGANIARPAFCWTPSCDANDQTVELLSRPSCMTCKNRSTATCSGSRNGYNSRRARAACTW